VRLLDLSVFDHVHIRTFDGNIPGNDNYVRICPIRLGFVRAMWWLGSHCWDMSEESYLYKTAVVSKSTGIAVLLSKRVSKCTCYSCCILLPAIFVKNITPSCVLTISGSNLLHTRTHTCPKTYVACHLLLSSCLLLLLASFTFTHASCFESCSSNFACSPCNVHRLPNMSTNHEQATFQYCKDHMTCLLVPKKPKEWLYATLLHNIGWDLADDCQPQRS
jgi:hypothetical protein